MLLLSLDFGYWVWKLPSWIGCTHYGMGFFFCCFWFSEFNEQSSYWLRVSLLLFLLLVQPCHCFFFSLFFWMFWVCFYGCLGFCEDAEVFEHMVHCKVDDVMDISKDLGNRLLCFLFFLFFQKFRNPSWNSGVDWKCKAKFILMRESNMKVEHL